MARKRTRPTTTTDYLRMLRRLMKAAGSRVAFADVEDLAELIAIRAELDAAIHAAVTGLNEAGYSWRAIGEATGTSKQAAMQKWAKKPPAPHDDSFTGSSMMTASAVS